MKNISLIILSLFLISCLPKELRQKKRCNKKLERLVEKCPQLLQKDTIRDTITIKVPELLIKDSLYVKVDTMQLLEYVTKEQVRYVVRSISLDTTINHVDYTLIFRLSNGLFSHNITIKEKTIDKPIETIIDVVKPVELSLFEKAYLYTNGWFKWILALIFLYLLYRFLKSFTDLR
jgi:hypothetical protein